MSLRAGSLTSASLVPDLAGEFFQAEQTTAIIGHGRSPQGKGWGKRIDQCDTVIRMWDHIWQDAEDYGTKYDIGLFEVHRSLVEKFWAHNPRNPKRGWIASLLGPTNGCRIPDKTLLIDQKPWNKMGIDMGGMGATKRLQFTRGTIAACWAIENAEPEHRVILVGFDVVRMGVTKTIEEAFPQAYRAHPASFSFVGHKSGQTKYGNHDYACERPLLQHLADKHEVKLVFADDVW